MSPQRPWDQPEFDFITHDDDGVPILPYAGTSGASGSSASHDRAAHEDATGVTSARQRLTLDMLGEAKGNGLTWLEIHYVTGLHHGQVTGLLSVLHKAGRIARLRERRNHCSVYVMPEWVQGRATEPHGRRSSPTKFETVCERCGHSNTVTV